jgi:hypothetical protein
MALVLLAGCTTVAINPNDGSAPNVTIKVQGPNGYQVATSTNYANSSAQEPVNIMCIVEDPQGVKSINLHVSDVTVDAVNCGGAIYSGNYSVNGLPAPISDTLSGASGKVPTKLSGIMQISGILEAQKPLGVTKKCYPANNTHITVRCQGGNWASNAAVATASTTLQVNF